MCGIAGILWYGPGPSPVTSPLLQDMVRTLAHRGPDDEGVFLSADRKVGLANRRLAILDLSPQGRMPMSGKDDKVWITYNGEIYNYRELRESLGRASFRTNTDTEVALRLFESEGEEFVTRLRGMFAFAIWDGSRLFLARDRLGIKPLYFTRTPQAFVFGSEIKAILATGLIRPRMDPAALVQFLEFGKVMAPHTLFENIRKLEPGQSMTVSADGSLKFRTYWDIPTSSPPPSESEEALTEGLLEKLRQSVRAHLISDVPIGVFLSGGVDSSLVAALVAEAEPSSLRTFTLGFEGYDRFNELEESRWTARRLGAHHRDISIAARDALGFFEKFQDHQEEPVANPVWMAVYFVSRLARESGVKVVLSGDGGDELFAGYDKWMTYLKIYRRFWRFYRRAPRALKWLGAKAGGLSGRRGVSDVLAREELFVGGTTFKEAELRRLLTPEFIAAAAGNPEYRVVDRLRGRFRGDDYLDWMMYLSLKTDLLEDYLMRLDKMGMAASVEGRVPLLDHEFVEAAVSAPAPLKYRGYERKRLLKKIAARVLPGEIVDRKKKGFCAPIQDWLLGEMGERLRDSVRGFVRRQTEFDPAGFEGLYEEFRRGRGNPAGFWALMDLAIWHDRWIRGR
jgi:asparagine synthase (glutamine-hydrolysing)